MSLIVFLFENHYYSGPIKINNILRFAIDGLDVINCRVVRNWTVPGHTHSHVYIFDMCRQDGLVVTFNFRWLNEIFFWQSFYCGEPSWPSIEASLWPWIEICLENKGLGSQMSPEYASAESFVLSSSGHFPTWKAWWNPAMTVLRGQNAHLHLTV